MNLNELINKKIEERIDEALEKYFSEPEETNASAPEKTDHDLYVEEFALLQSRPGLTRKELREDKRWQEFLAKRPGPKMEIVYNDYLCHLERERLAQENADLRKRLAEANADFVNFKLELEAQSQCQTKKSTPVELYPVGPLEPRMVYANLKRFIEEQKLTQAEFAELIGTRKESSKHANSVYISDIINGKRKKLNKFWRAVKKTFDLTNEQLSELKKTEEAK